MTSDQAESTAARFHRLAAANNADWCDAVAHAHGIATRRTADLWWAERPTPTGFPEAVTLAPGVDAEVVLAAVGTARGTSVKDSFGDLDLSAGEFRVLFEAEWLGRPGSTAGRTPLLNWHTVGSVTELAEWVHLRGEGDAFLPDLLGVPDISVLGAYDGERLVGGAVANLSRGPAGSSVLGLSNVFGATATLEVIWQDLVTLTSQSLPGLPLVGWEGGDDVLPPLAARFDVVGALRVWMR